MTERSLFAERALLPDGWSRDVLIEIGADGGLAAVTPGAAAGAVPRAAGPVVPGMPNLHSHAFQRAMAGLAERAGPGDDSFWTWREVMYGFVRRLTPDQAGAVAAQPTPTWPRCRGTSSPPPGVPVWASPICRCSTASAVSAARRRAKASAAS
jgi:cytosine/adenosine deaminase-related metal-dependent hydrolase